MSGKTSRTKGAVFERRVRNWLEERGYEVINPARTGFDGGDAVLPEYSISLECKNHQEQRMHSWQEQAAEQAEREGMASYAVVHKRRGHDNIGAQWVTMTLDQFSELLLRLDGDVRWERDDETQRWRVVE